MLTRKTLPVRFIRLGKFPSINPRTLHASIVAKQAEQIRQYGLERPLRVKSIGKDKQGHERYELVDGFYSYAALKELKIPYAVCWIYLTAANSDPEP